MNTPDDWREQMLKDEHTRKILANVDSEDCLAVDLQSAFADALDSRRPHTSPGVAQEAARAVVEAEPDKFLCKGRRIPGSRFAQAVRFDRPETWPYLVDNTNVEQRLRRRYGLEASGALGGLSNRQRAAFAAHLAGQELQVGRPGLVAWVAESASVPWRGGGLRDILRRLGLPHFEAENLTIVSEYGRASVGRPFHVPRAFDGIGWWPFQLETRCDADTGTTRPLDVASPGATGYPEGVHRSKRFRVSSVELRTIND